jgi:hypothetical protein
VYVGRLYCIGEYTNNTYGKLYSVPIHVPAGHWWNKFNADYTASAETGGNNSITFTFLDGNGNQIVDEFGATISLNGSNNAISDQNVFNTGSIQICAEFVVDNESEDWPELYNWGLTWTDVVSPPEFVNNSFKPDESGWINTNLPVCSIQVFDSYPGLDVDSAEYRVFYTDNTESDWISTNCTGVSGTNITQTITCDLSELNLDDENASKLKSIEIQIKDLAGNNANFSLDQNFRLDTQAPSSWFETTFDDIYTSSFQIIADANDPGDSSNSSGIETVALNYRLKGDTEWINYGSKDQPFIWNFDPPVAGELEIVIVAMDNATNYENISEKTIISFIYDDELPEFITVFETIDAATIPIQEIVISDSYKLEKLEFRFEAETTWETIETEINDTDYSIDWVLPSDYWHEMYEDVEYYIFFRITDSVGNEKETTYSNTLIVIKNENATQPNLDLSDFSEFQWNDKFTITASLPDELDITKIALYYRYSEDEEKWSDWELFGKNQTKEPYKWTFTAEYGNGYYEFRIKTTLASGAVITTTSETVNVTVFPLILLIEALILIFIFLIVTILLIKKIKTKKKK